MADPTSTSKTPESPLPTPEPLDGREALRAIDRAEKAVDDLCQGRLRWEMRVPAEPDHDPDLIISEALRLSRAALAALPDSGDAQPAEKPWATFAAQHDESYDDDQPAEERLRAALEASMQDIGLGTDERLDRAVARVRSTLLAAIDAVALSEDSLPGDGFDSWADGFRQGWRAAREAVERA